MKEKQKYWNREYEKGVHWEEQVHSSGVEKLAGMLKPESSILDIGCGSGRDCFYFARSGFDVTGIDISSEAIRKAEEYAKKHNMKIRFDAMCAENLLYEDEAFNAVYSNDVLQLTDLECSIPEIYRVLKKGGICYLSIILSTTELQAGRTIGGKYSVEYLISSFRNFNILSHVQYEKTDEKPSPHKHEFLVLGLEKE